MLIPQELQLSRKNLHRIRVFLTDLQYFAYQENVVGFLLLSKLKTVGK